MADPPVMSLECGTIFTREEDLKEGLFGGVFLFILEVLPYLRERGIKPHWRIDTTCYGNVVPTVLEPVEPVGPVLPEVSLSSLRQEDRRAIGGDFEGISKLWNSYFRPAQRVLDEVERIDPGLDRAIGIHYRGGDKLKASWDTNPIDRTVFMDIVQDRIADEPVFDRCLVATDDPAFIGTVRRRIDLPLTILGAGERHKSSRAGRQSEDRAVMALRDAILLSRCRSILQTSSALPSFAKVLRPEVDCRRCTASKWFAEIPYFPVAFVRKHRPVDPGLQAVVDKAMRGDWTTNHDVDPSVWNSIQVPWSMIARSPMPTGRLGNLLRWVRRSA